MIAGRVPSTRDQRIVVDAPVDEVFTRLFDIGARPAWSGTVGRVQLLREVDPDIRSWTVERRIRTRRVAVVYHVSAATPQTCVEVRVSIEGSGVVTRYELSAIPGGTSVHITGAEFCRGGRPSRRVAVRLHRLARLLERDDELLLGAPARTPAPPAVRDVSRPLGSRHNRRG